MSRRDAKARGALTDLAPHGNLSCLLTTADPDLALQTHFLYEIGGNIGKHDHVSCIFLAIDILVFKGPSLGLPGLRERMVNACNFSTWA